MRRATRKHSFHLAKASAKARNLAARLLVSNPLGAIYFCACQAQVARSQIARLTDTSD